VQGHQPHGVSAAVHPVHVCLQGHKGQEIVQAGRCVVLFGPTFRKFAHGTDKLYKVFHPGNVFGVFALFVEVHQVEVVHQLFHQIEYRSFAGQLAPVIQFLGEFNQFLFETGTNFFDGG